MAKTNQTLVADRLNEHTDYFMQPHKSNQCNWTDTEDKDSVNGDNTKNMPYRANEQTDTLKI